MKKILAILTIPLLILSCSKKEEVKKETEKKDFFVEVQSYSGFTKTTDLDKTGKLGSSQNINLTSNAGGRVTSVLVKEGDKVSKGEVLASLEDNIGSYAINLSKANNALDRAKINYDSTSLNLDKNIFDLEINVKSLKNNLEALKKEKDESLKKAKSDLENSKYDGQDSKTQLSIEKLENTIKKQELDYNNKLISDTETIDGFRSSLKNDYNSLVILMDDVIEFSDSLLPVTDLHRDDDDKFKDFIGARDRSQRTETKNILKDLILFKETKFSSLNFDNLTEEEILSNIDEINLGYEKIKILLNSMEQTLNNSIDSDGSFSLNDIAGHKLSVNTYQGSLQGSYSVFISFGTSVKSFLNTYKLNQKSLQKQIDLLKKDLIILKKDREILNTNLDLGEVGAETGLEKIIINYDDRIKSLELQIDSAINSLDNAKKSKTVNLRSLNNSIKEAQIGVTQAQKEYSKLTIESPISGVIGKIFIDVGQEVNIGSPAFSILNTGDNEVQISFNKNELNFVSEGSKVFMDFEEKTYTGSIYSISKTADSNLKYTSRISFDEDLDLIGNIVSIRVPIELNNVLMPMNIIKVNNSGIGTINIFTGGLIEQKDIKLGNIYNDKIEVLEEINPELNIITNYVDNYDSEKFELRVKE